MFHIDIVLVYTVDDVRYDWNALLVTDIRWKWGEFFDH
jgi:hypothetical protein